MFEQLMKMVEELGEDVMYFVDKDKMVHLTIDDFEGFDDDYEEIYREYDEEKVDGLLQWLEESCVSYEDDFYSIYQFDGFSVKVGYSSYDI